MKSTVSRLFSIPDYSSVFDLSRVQVCRGTIFCLSFLHVWDGGCLTGNIRWQHPTHQLKWGVHFQKPLSTWCKTGNMPVPAHSTAAVWVANQKKSIFNSVTLSHCGTETFLRSNRLTPFLWLWYPFFFSSRTTMAKGKKKGIRERGRCSTCSRGLTYSPQTRERKRRAADECEFRVGSMTSSFLCGTLTQRLVDSSTVIWWSNL